MSQRAQIISEARSWLGTKFHHQGRIKKSKTSDGGVDCLGLIIGVASKLDIKIQNKPVKSYDYHNYSKIPDGEFLRKNFDNLFERTNLKNAQSGDIALFKFKEQPQHVGFIHKESGIINPRNNYPMQDDIEKSELEKPYISLIHCYMQARGVVEHKLDKLWQSRIMAIYKIL